MLDRIKETVQGLLGKSAPAPPPRPGADAVDPVHPKVLMIVHNPPVASEGGKRLTEVFNWHDPAKLAEGYIDDLRTCSDGYLKYEIVERIDADWYPPKEDGFRYTEESYLKAWRGRKRRQPDLIDYPAQIKAFELDTRSDRGEFDEVWFFAFPFAGDYESTMAGPGAFWCNSPPVPGTGHCKRRFVIMGFNYERGVDCMLENFGHRTESIMRRVYEPLGQRRNKWELFTRYDKIAPGAAHCGNVHFAPNSEKDYDWGNKRPVTSFCDDWLTYPELAGRSRTMTSADWGNGDMRLHHLWWLSHLPNVPGETDGVANNWWQYIVDPNLVW